MKVRNGFVSNSSSSSFVIMLPDDLDVKKVIEEKYKDIDSYSIGELYEEYELEKSPEEEKRVLLEIANNFIKEGYVWSEKYIEMSLIPEIFDDYVIAQIDGGPDDGSVELLSEDNVKRIKKILNCK